MRGWQVHLLSFALLLVLSAVQEPQDRDTLHHTSGRVSEEFTAGFQGAIYPDVVLGCHEEVARFGRVVRGLLGDIVPTGTVGVVPITGVSLSEDRIQRLLYSSGTGVSKTGTGGIKTISRRATTYGGLMCHPLR